MENQSILAGIFIVIGLILTLSILSPMSTIKTDTALYNSIKKNLGREPLTVTKPRKTKTFAVYALHYLGYLFTAMGGGLLSHYIVF